MGAVIVTKKNKEGHIKSLLWANTIQNIFSREFKSVEGKLIEIIRLENGHILEMFDHSRHVAGDRWLVSFEARVEVKVKPEYFEGDYNTDISVEDVQTLLGEKASYRYRKERNFIAETEREAVLKDLKERFLDTNLGYISSPEFPRRLVHRKYQESHSQMLLWKIHQNS